MPIEQPIMRTEHPTHPAFAEQLLQVITPEKGPRLEIVVRYDRLMAEGDATIPLSQLGAAPTADTSLLVIHGGRVDVHALPADGAIIIGRGEDATLRIDDPGLSRRHALLEQGEGGWRVTDLASRNGTLLHGQRLPPNQPTPLPFDAPLSLGTSRLLLQGRSTDTPAAGPRAAALALVRRVAGVDLNVLLTGEPGTGKRTAARLLHQLSPRVAQPLTVHDCAKGRLDAHRIARPGTLLLTGIETLDPLGQIRLADVLRELQDVRLIGTRADEGGGEAALVDLVGEVWIHLPAVRVLGDELRGVLTELVAESVKRLGLRHTPTITDAAVEAIRQHPWPNNLADIVPLLDRAVIDGDGHTIDAPDLTVSGADALTEEERREKERILAALAACAGNQTRAAERLHISRGTLVARLKKYGIRRPRPRKR